eukprot:4772839-Amphidinium_carterae.2
MQQKRFGWSMSRSLREAKLMSPELFNNVTDSVPRRRPKMLKDAELTILSGLAVNNCSQVPIAAPALQPIFNKQLKDMGTEHAVSVSSTGGSSFASPLP